MPELPEVETAVRGLRPMLVGQQIRRIIIRQPRLRWPVPDDLGQRLTGAQITAIRRRAKYGLMDSNRGETLIFHLGMSGRFALLEGTEPPDKHDHVLFETDAATLAYRDPRRFGSMHLVATEAADAHPLLAHLGPEPLSDEFDADRLIRAAHRRRTPIKALLLDQRVVAGLGNIYVSEALFAAGIHPARQAGRIAPRRLERLVPAIQDILQRAITAGGSTLRDHAGLKGDSGYFQMQFQVYGRADQPCVTCARPIRRITQSGRSSFYCPACQT